MATARELGFEAKRAATGAIGTISVGITSDGAGIVVAKTTNGEGYTLYHNYYDALVAFDEIVCRAGLVLLAI